MNSTVSGNSASENGGGIAGNYYGDLVATNSTISGNSAGNLGGGIWNGKSFDVVLLSSTVASNTASFGGGLSDFGSFYTTEPDIFDSIVGYNAGGDCGTIYYPISNNSFDSDGSCGFSNPLQGLDPTLADNGGPTRTHALLANATPIDGAGDCGLTEDQRGLPRSDGACDSGSLEFGAAPVGGSAFGHRVQRVTCRNVTTAQTVSVQQPLGAWDCEAAGLVVSPGDRVRQKVVGLSGDLDLGGTSIALSQLQASCQNVTTGQQARFTPSGTLTWSCLDQGLAYQIDDRVIQVFDGVAD